MLIYLPILIFARGCNLNTRSLHVLNSFLVFFSRIYVCELRSVGQSDHAASGPFISNLVPTAYSFFFLSRLSRDKGPYPLLTP